MAAAPPILEIVQQHVDESIMLHDLRSRLVAAPHVAMTALSRLDERLAAHLDGLAVAGEHAWPLCDAALETPSADAVFVAAVCAVRDRQSPRIHALIGTMPSEPLRSGMTSAFGWLERHELQGLAAPLLAASDPVSRSIGLAACAVHHVDPGMTGSSAWLRDSDALVRAHARRAAAELGRRDLELACTSGFSAPEPDCRFWAAWSGVLLGNRSVALDALTGIGLQAGRYQPRAFTLALQAMSPTTSHNVLQRLARDPQELRWLIRGSGVAGDSVYVPWLISHMDRDQTARLAGEAFSLISGVDLAEAGLERSQPEGFESGPNDDSDDPNVEIDPDEGLPWPDPERVKDWWARNGGRFQSGQRYFMGAPVTREHCIDVLKNGYQRQRILAAHYLCLLEPGTPLFNTSAPAWRQQRLLAEMK